MSKHDRPEASASVATGDGAALKVLRSAMRAREKAELAEHEAVRAARVAGVSWARIGELYGLTKQGAQQRFKPARPQVPVSGG